MGFYLRKSIRVGPLRFNLSGSGIGVSAGIPGLRFGTGPRGNYVHMGRGGLYFRKTLNSRSSVPSNDSVPGPQGFRETTTPLQEIESGSVQQMTDSSSADFLSELDQKRRLIRFLPLVLVGGIIAVGATVAAHLPPWLYFSLGAAAVVASWYFHQRDQLRKTTVVFYEFDDVTESRYNQLHSAFEQLRLCSAVWHVGSRGDVLDRKYHAGASAVVTRKMIAPGTGEPPLLKTNVSVPIVSAGRQTLAFMPDRLLVIESTGVGAVSYADLLTESGQTQFVEEEAQPSDAVVIGRTWRYVNKKGGPDRRFNNNPELPIMHYGMMSLKSASGLNELFQASRVDAVKAFESALKQMAIQQPASDR